jgi:hypothetical protein
MIARALIVVIGLCVACPASAQTKPAAPPPDTPQKPATPAKPAPPAKQGAQAKPSSSPQQPVSFRGFGTFGAISFQAQDSFDAILGSHGGPSFGGGAQVLLPLGFYAEFGVWRFTHEGERVFVGPNQEVFPLGIPLDVTITPIEITGGWRYHHCPQPPRAPKAAKPIVTRPCAPRLIPYAGGGFSSYAYRETSDSAAADEDVSSRFGGFHLLGGVDYKVTRWVSIGGEAAWSSVPNALGEGGVSAAFEEDNLGGMLVRLKVTVGR